MITLYKKHASSVGRWRIWAEGGTIHIAHSTALDGSEVRHKELIREGLAGRTLQEQVNLRINSRVSRMRDKGYKDTQAEAQSDQSNQMGLHRPMLAQQIDKVRNVNYTGAVLQKKLDGHRCLVTCEDGRVIAYSRQGKPIQAIRHILRGLEGRIPEGTTIDGELYCHGHPLQTLSSWIKREQVNTYQLNLVVYDLISPDSYRDRHAELTEIVHGVDTGTPGRVLPLPFRDYESKDETARWFDEVRRQGFEGLMLRVDRRGYEIGRRSSGLLKIKHFHDEEFEVVGFKASKTGWAICICKTADGKRFDCSAPGTVVEKEIVYLNQSKFLGRKLTVAFSHWTLDGLPFQPTALRWYTEI